MPRFIVLPRSRKALEAHMKAAHAHYYVYGLPLSEIDFGEIRATHHEGYHDAAGQYPQAKHTHSRTK